MLRKHTYACIREANDNWLAVYEAYSFECVKRNNNNLQKKRQTKKIDNNGPLILLFLIQMKTTKKAKKKTTPKQDSRMRMSEWRDCVRVRESIDGEML